MVERQLPKLHTTAAERYLSVRAGCGVMFHSVDWRIAIFDLNAP
jgi:hypothetical protein